MTRMFRGEPQVSVCVKLEVLDQIWVGKEPCIKVKDIWEITIRFRECVPVEEDHPKEKGRNKISRPCFIVFCFCFYCPCLCFYSYCFCAGWICHKCIRLNHGDHKGPAIFS